ncbi:MAG: C39 family peptidase [Xylanivirga thermophila]|jgi:hypothetical protein|uniref:hypothetical protein n=1 Tax=Xylanivirga thermophila TaxID=2496273 RepID=UPI0039F5AD3D
MKRSHIAIGIITIILIFATVACQSIKLPFLHKVELVIQETYPPTPLLTGPGDNIDNANKNLSEYLKHIYTAISNLEKNNIDAPILSYALTGDKPSFSLEVDISRPDGHSIEELVFSINVDTGDVKLKQPKIEDTLKDSEFIYNTLYLAMKGINIPLDSYKKTVTIGSLAELLTNTYESMAGHEIDTTDIINVGTLVQRKALAIDLLNVNSITDNENSILDVQATLENSIELILKWHEIIKRDIYGLASQHASLDDTWNLLFIFSKITNMNFANKKVKEQIDGLLDTSQPLTRLDLAKVLVTIEEMRLGEEIIYKYNGWQDMADTDDPYANKADITGILMRYNNNNAFYPQKMIQFREIYPPLLNIINRSYVLVDENERGKPLSYKETINIITMLFNELAQPKPHEEKVVVVNERPYDWYVNQYETGEYGQVNCMPASMEMVLKWRNSNNTITTEELRKEYICDGGGWYDTGLINELERHKVPYTLEWDFSLETMLFHLDSANILIVMYNDGVDFSGHAVVVKGYRKIPAGVWVICNDPSTFEPVGKYGRPDGIGREMEAKELLWEMERHSSWYIVIPPATA